MAAATATGPAQDRVLIMDFGSQFAQLIARRCRELHVYGEIVRHDLPASRLRELAPRGIILSGGPASVYEVGAPRCDPAIFDLGIPVLGICYGLHLLSQILGVEVTPHAQREFGRTDLHVTTASDLFTDLPTTMAVWMSHGDQVQTSPEFQTLARTSTCETAAVRHRQRPIFGLQFHPEVTHTTFGNKILENFLHRVCGCQGEWRMSSYLEAAVRQIREQVGTDRVICGLSGGVDSSVTAALLHRAIGPQLTCIFVDNGLLRRGEREAVEQTFRDHFSADLRVVDASKLFLDRLQSISDPQQKRSIIGHAFIDVFKDQARTIRDAKFLAQGTLYPDVIESGGALDGPAATIKTHHNVGGLPAELGFELIEPLRNLFKDEARQLGLELGLPTAMIWRHPFPGPGLAVRCLGEVTADRLELLRSADTIFLEELHRADVYRDVAQAFCVLLPVNSVGVMGDGRTYQPVVALRAVTTSDFMTADWAVLDPALLGRISTRIVNEVRGVNRVVYDISTKPPATIEWE